MAVRLVPIGEGRPIVFEKTILLVGRGDDCDVILTNSKKISRKHCALAIVGKRLVIRDLGSMNGVWVNGERVGRQSDIEVGDEVAIGDIQFRLEVYDSTQRKNGSANSDSARVDQVETGTGPVDASRQQTIKADVRDLPIPDKDSNLDDSYVPLRDDDD